MRSICFTALVLLGGCYDPHIVSGGFTCNPPASPECPEGFQCVDGRCVDGTTPIVQTDDASVSGVIDLAPMSSPDQARPSMPDLAPQPPPPDLAPQPPPPDLAQPAPDLTPACVPNGGSCNYHKDSSCCSGYCDWSTEKCA